jgi:hypothetical protein
MVMHRHGKATEAPLKGWRRGWKNEMSNVKLRPCIPEMTSKKTLKCFCCISIFGALIGMLAYQRLLLIEARNLAMHQSRVMMSAYSCLKVKRDIPMAMSILEPHPRVFINYLLYREVMFIEAANVTKMYCKLFKDKIDEDFSNRISDYSSEVREKCYEKPTYYYIFDHQILISLFPVFAPNGEIYQEHRGYY